MSAAVAAGRSRLTPTSLAFGAALAVAAVVLGVRHTLSGPWLDEFFSIYASNPERSLSALWREVLLLDNHPPLFNLLAWSLRRGADFAVGGGRAINLAALIGFLVYWGLCWRRWPELRPVLTVFVLLLASSNQLHYHIADFRVYFAAVLACAAMALASLGLVRRPAAPPRAGDVIAFVAAVGLSANLHYLALLLAMFTTAAVLAVLAARRRWRTVAVVALASAAAAAPTVVFALVQATQLADRTGGSFWLTPTGPLEALKIVVRTVIFQTGVNIVASTLALAALFRIFRPLRLGRIAEKLPPEVLVLGGACGAFLLTLLLLNHHTPIIYPRYLSMQLGPACLLVSLLAARAARGRSWLFVAMALNALVVLVAFTFKLINLDLPRWSEPARAVAAAVEQCPSRPVYAVLRPGSEAHARLSDGMPADQVLAIGYRHMAERHGFQVRLVDGPGPTPLDPRCGAVFWFEHYLEDQAVNPQGAFRQYGLATPPGELRWRRGLEGAVVVASPASDAR